MRGYYFFLLPSAALAVIITKSSETSQSTVHLVPIRDVADRHRSGNSVNRALRAQDDLDDEERGVGALESVAKSTVSEAAKAIEKHAATPFNVNNFDETTTNFVLLTRILRKQQLVELMELMEELKVGEVTLVKKLVDVYGDEVIAQRLVQLSLRGNLSTGLSHLRDLMFAHWFLNKTAKDMITWIRATKNFEDKYLYHSEVRKFLSKFEDGDVNKAIMAAYEKSFSHYVSVMYRAHKLEKKNTLDIPAYKEAWEFLYRLLLSSQVREDDAFRSAYVSSLGADAQNGFLPYMMLDNKQIKEAQKMMEASTDTSPQPLENLIIANRKST
uniref:Avirulence protein HAC1Cala2 n=1 Tax=Hyaloperonospora arabidopsidis TaxID=272952 RepID=A0A2D0W1X1_HYAAB|nr:avirulence protein HAC1Cala2 [Hyaloperonospora arabidopsidis]